MITDNIIAAIQTMINADVNCIRQEGMELLLDMLCDFNDEEWVKMSEKDRLLWVKNYIPEFQV